jgi:DNA helicase-2/ATP-dependent DNA helicase PcrA
MRRFGYKEKDFPYFRTIHSLAFRALGLSKYDVINRAHYKEFSHVMGMSFVGYYTEDFINNDDRYLFYESLRKNNKKAAEKIFESLNYQNIRRVEHNYTRYKKHVGIKDFDDMIIDFITRGESIPVEIAIIDEAQDLTSLQWEFCRLAFRDCKRIYIAGDDDQAIYEWSGADI